MSLKARLIAAFEETYNAAPNFVVRSPGRVNLIGEHTDYNDGFVLPMAIDRAVWIAFRPRTDGQVHVKSLDFDATASFSLNTLSYQDAGWIEYIKGVAWVLLDKDYTLTGWDGVIAGDVPVGAGLSSSAALELATARCFAAVSDFDWDPKQMALLAQHAECEWIGMQCGVMDQLIAAAGQTDKALLIDCASLDMQPAPLPPGTAVIVMDTSTRRQLVDSAYNERRASCESVAAAFGLQTLRLLEPAAFEARFDQLDPVARRRARHVLGENARTLLAVEAMKAGDAATLGRLMNESHASLRDDFEVSSPALDQMAALAQAHPACFGARMTGAGFGGCAVALVKEGQAPAFVAHISSRYQADTGHEPSLYLCKATAGTTLMPMA
ncbi:MAG: galactokinase [Bacteroidota bacterium]